MKISTFVLIAILFSSSYLMAEPAENDFNLIVPSYTLVKQDKSPDEVIADIQRRLDAIQKQVDAIADRVGIQKPKTSDPFADNNKTPEYKKFLDDCHNQNKPVGFYPSSAPPTDGGPAWRYDATTGSYYRYIPAQQVPRMMYSRPHSYYVPQQSRYNYTYNYTPRPRYTYTMPTPTYSMPMMGGGGMSACPT
jgi:hypothetical protein